MANQQPREVLFEFVQQGRFVKVVAIDPASNTEVAVVGDRSASPESLKRVALNKLRFVLNRGQEPVVAPRRDDNLY